MSASPSESEGKSTPLSSDQPHSRYVVGIDLGTTNCAVAYVDTEDEPWRVTSFEIPQWVDWGSIERRLTLPSFLYQPPNELESARVPARQGGLPWENELPSHICGFLARDAGLTHPGRRIASAKSWLCHEAVDRTANLLPWQGEPDVPKLSPVDASATLLRYIRQAWDHQFPDAPLASQDVIITLPASFDEVARGLTVAAARKAGLARIYLIEEPQAAFYAWIDHHRDDWFRRVEPGQTILVCDIGGGTSDFTLIGVQPAGQGAGGQGAGGQGASQVQFHRIAVGKHLILGGDNIDLALAQHMEPKLASGGELSPRQWERLVQVCRSAKEIMLGANPPTEITLSLPSEGSRLIGGGKSAPLSAAEVQQVLIDGFFPVVPRDARPDHASSGFREFGLPYADDPAITRHLAEFLALHSSFAGSDQEAPLTQSPPRILFNGGVMKAARLRERLTESIGSWFSIDREVIPEVLDARDLDLAVAHGAAYFGMVRRGRGVRIAANLGRSYYMQIAEQPPETMCLIPGSAEAGQTYQPAIDLVLQLGEPVQFPLWVSSTRMADQSGDFVSIDRQHLSPLPPLRTVLVRSGGGRQSHPLEVRIEAQLSEIGTLELFCVQNPRDGSTDEPKKTSPRWQLEFDIRSTLETDRQGHCGIGEAAGIVDQATIDACSGVLAASFSPPPSTQTGAQKQGASSPDTIMQRLRDAAQIDRREWPPSLLRQLWHSLVALESGRRLSPLHEARWLNLIGYFLRPGYGMAVDDWRVHQVWKIVYGKLAFATPQSRTESLILWRRVAGGLTPGQQSQLATPAIQLVRSKGNKLDACEGAELWRMLGSLESLPSPLKMTLVTLAIEAATGNKKGNGPSFAAAILWALGRLSSRRPIYGPLNAVVPPEVAARAVESLTQGQDFLPVRQLAVAQAAQRTGDRFRDLAPRHRDVALRWLRETAAPERYLAQVEEGGGIEEADAAALFGEQLPLGIRLIR